MIRSSFAVKSARVLFRSEASLGLVVRGPEPPHPRTPSLLKAYYAHPTLAWQYTYSSRTVSNNKAEQRKMMDISEIRKLGEIDGEFAKVHQSRIFKA